jgi:DNA primase
MTPDVETIRSASDIVSVVGQYVPLKKNGSQVSGLCPFHREKSPSFFVHPSKQVYRCHGCGAGGDVFNFVMGVKQIGFREAKELLAARAGIAIAPATATQVSAWAKAADERELIEHFRLVEGIFPERVVEGVSPDRPRMEFNKRIAAELNNQVSANPEYLEWLKDDLAHAQALCGVLVGVIAIAQERESAI